MNTCSFWSYVLENSQKYLNKLYDENYVKKKSQETEYLGVINVSIANLRLWKEHFMNGLKTTHNLPWELLNNNLEEYSYNLN